MHEARRRARAGAEQRKILSAGSGQKLGGAPVRRGQDIRKVIADAATRRITVTRGCASGSSKEREREIMRGTDRNGCRTKAEEDDANEEAIMLAYIDLVQEDEKERYGEDYVPPSKENPAGSQGARSSKATQELAATKPQPNSEPKASRHPPVPSSTRPRANKTSAEPIDLDPPIIYDDDTWTCEVCTLINLSNHLCCGACDVERPSRPTSPTPRNVTPSTQNRPSTLRDSNAKKAVRSLISLDETTKQQPKKPVGWLCRRCGNFMEEQWWTCANCGLMKQSS